MVSFTRDQVKEWNNKPEIKESNVKLVPSEDAEIIYQDKNIIQRKNITIFLLMVVVVCLGIFTYLAWNNQLHLANCAPSLNMTCSAVQCSSVTVPPINIPACPVCPTNNFTCNPIIKFCGNSTC